MVLGKRGTICQKYWDQLEVLFSGPFPKPKSCWLATECQQPTELTQHNLVA